jgi:hypothetical protein
MIHLHRPQNPPVGITLPPLLPVPRRTHMHVLRIPQLDIPIVLRARVFRARSRTPTVGGATAGVLRPAAPAAARAAAEEARADGVVGGGFEDFGSGEEHGEGGHAGGDDGEVEFDDAAPGGPG